MGIIKRITTSFSYLKNDRIVLFLSSCPILIGVVLYYYLGKWLYGDAFSWIKLKLSTYISFDSYGTFLGYILATLFSLIMFFFINWTFVLVVSLLASPFNDFLSERIEKLYLKNEINFSNQFKGILNRLFFVFVTEFKKISFIIVLNIFALIFSWIPFLLPISLLISASLLAVNFLDYSWSRHNLTLKECISNFKKAWISNMLVGSLLFVLITIPIINLFLISLSVIYFTLTYVEHQNEIK